MRNIAKIVRALRDIASGTPAVTKPGTKHERACPLCRAHIDHARAALGYAPWPEIPATSIAKQESNR